MAYFIVNSKFRNKRGISTIMLAIGVVLICATAIFTFLIANNSIQSSFVTPVVIENLTNNINTFYFYNNSGLSYQQAADYIGAQIQGNQLILSGEQAPIQTSGSQPAMSAKYIVNLPS